MFGRFLLVVLLVVVLVGGAAAFGYYTYNMGVAQGMAANGTAVTPAPVTGVAPYPYYAPFFFHPFGFGWGLFACFFGFLFIFLIFALLRGLFWGRRGWGHPGMYAGWRGGWDPDRPVPPMVQELHRKLHEMPDVPQQPPTTQAS